MDEMNLCHRNVCLVLRCAFQCKLGPGRVPVLNSFKNLDSDIPPTRTAAAPRTRPPKKLTYTLTVVERQILYIWKVGRCYIKPAHVI